MIKVARSHKTPEHDPVLSVRGLGVPAPPIPGGAGGPQRWAGLGGKAAAWAMGVWVVHSCCDTLRGRGGAHERDTT